MGALDGPFASLSDNRHDYAGCWRPCQAQVAPLIANISARSIRIKFIVGVRGDLR
jgi:hypothetical protein